MKHILPYLSHAFSLVFHPLLMILYLWGMLMLVDPFLFPANDTADYIQFFVYTLVSALIIPVISIFIMKMLGFVKSLQMNDKKERIGPMIVIGSLYLWMYVNFRNNAAVPDIFVSLVLGSIIAIFIAFFINNFSKISLHMVGAGGLIIGTWAIISQAGSSSFVLPIPFFGKALISNELLLIASIFVSGLVGSSRLYLKAHVPRDIYGGFLVGAFAQILAYLIVF